MSNQQIKTNLETLLAAVEAHPEDLFNLDSYKKDEPCGTLFCTVGLACTMPYFVAMGFGFGSDTYWDGTISYWAELNGEHIQEYTVKEDLHKIFGQDAWRNLFAPAGDGYTDDVLGYEEEFTVVGHDEDGDALYVPNMTDKELAVARLKNQIAIYSEA